MRTLDVQQTAATFLKHHTAFAHQNLENIVLPRLQAMHSLPDYISLLKQFYGYFKPVEQQIEAWINNDILPDIQQRRKADLILHDLTFSKAHSVHLPLAARVPQLTNVRQAFGALYVLEGSTLGSRGITRTLLKNERLHLHEDQVRFFSGYGAETGPMWLAFLEKLNRYGDSDTALTEMTTAANETFTLFQHWLQANP